MAKKRPFYYGDIKLKILSFYSCYRKKILAIKMLFFSLLMAHQFLAPWHLYLLDLVLILDSY